MLRGVGAAYNLLLRVLWVAAMATLPIAAAVITFEVVMRYLFNAPTRWAIDFAAFSLLWITFLAAPRLVRERGHITIEFAVGFLRPRVRRGLEAVTSVAAAAVASILFWAGLTATINAWVTGALTIGSWEIPRAYVWVVIPIGSAFLAIEFVRFAILAARDAARGEVYLDVVPGGAAEGDRMGRPLH